jgi:hypothetical protein
MGIECKCKNGHTCHPRPDSIRQGSGMCRKCAGLCSEDAAEQFEERITNFNGEVLGKYINSYSAVKCRCREGHIVMVLPGGLKKRKSMCRKCSGKCHIEAEKVVRERAAELGALILSEYVNMKTRLKMQCKNKHICYVYPSNLHKPDRGICNKCANHCPEQGEQHFREDMEEMEAEVIGEYVNNYTKIECICKRGHTCYPTPTSIQRGNNCCVKCKYSKGERMVEKVLTVLEIPYKREVYHPSLGLLRFDFKFEYKGKTIYLEFDGVQHQEESKLFHKKAGEFAKLRQRDLLKNYTCLKEVGTRLIRLDYSWVKERKSKEELEAYLVQALKSKDKIIANPKVYTWIDDVPTKATQKMYTKGIKGEESEEEEYFEDSDEEEDSIEETKTITKEEIKTKKIRIVVKNKVGKVLSDKVNIIKVKKKKVRVIVKNKEEIVLDKTKIEETIKVKKKKIVVRSK